MTEKPIELCQFLKVAGFAQTGGEAKHLIQSGEVLLNGEVETRRGKKLAEGDQVTLGSRTATVPARLAGGEDRG